MTTKAKLIAAAIVVAGVATPIAIQQMSVQKLERQNLELRSQVAQLDELEALRAENTRLAGLAVDRAELERLRKEHLELLTLRGEVGLLRDASSQLSNQVAKLTTRRDLEIAQAQEAAREAAAAAAVEEPNEWISTATRLRNALISGEPLSAEELKWLTDAKPAIEQMEREPKQFSEFQTALIKATVGSIDEQRLAQIEKLIARTYQSAVAGGLDLPSKPAENYAEWVERRHALDRAATRAVQGLLTPEERTAFDSRFLGVMGVDLGTGVDSSNYPPDFLGGGQAYNGPIQPADLSNAIAR